MPARQGVAQTVEKVNFSTIFIGGHVPTMKIPLGQHRTIPA